MHLLIAAHLIALTVAACGSEQQDAGQVDGQPAIVDNSAASWPSGRAWTIGSEPALSIGSGDRAEYQLHGVSGAIRLPDGGIAVGNAGSSEVRFFDAAGRFLLTVGRSGGGPAEFRHIESLVPFPGDSLAVLDVGNRRLTIISPQGEIGRSVSIRSLSPSAKLAGVFDNGAFLIGVHQPVAPQEGVTRDSMVYLLFTRDGARIDTLATGPGATQFQRVSGNRVSRMTVPFGPMPSATARGSQAYIASTDEFEIQQYTEDGRLERIIRRSVERRLFTQAHFDQFIERYPRFGAALQGVPHPAHLPAFSAMLADPDGNLWVQDYQELGSDSNTWAVFEQSGRLLGTINLPGNFRVTDIGRDHVTGVWLDELDVEHVRSYPLQKPR